MRKPLPKFERREDLIMKRLSFIVKDVFHDEDKLDKEVSAILNCRPEDIITINDVLFELEDTEEELGLSEEKEEELKDLIETVFYNFEEFDDLSLETDTSGDATLYWTGTYKCVGIERPFHGNVQKFDRRILVYYLEDFKDKLYEMFSSDVVDYFYNEFEEVLSE